MNIHIEKRGCECLVLGVIVCVLVCCESAFLCVLHNVEVASNVAFAADPHPPARPSIT